MIIGPGKGPHRRLMRLSGTDRGESSVSYVAVVLLIVTIIGAMVVSDLPAQVSGGVEAAVCKVGGVDCAPDKTIRSGGSGGGGSPSGSGGEGGRGEDTGGDPDTIDYWDCGWAGREACDIVQGLGRGFKDAWADFGAGIKQMFTDPGGTAKTVADEETKVYRQAQEDDHPGVGASYTVIGILGAVFGGRKLKEIRDVGDAARKAGKPGRSEPEGDRLSEAERNLSGRRVVGMRELDPGSHVNGAFLVEFEDGSSAVYKPADTHSAGKRNGIRSARQEVAAARLDEILGFDLVPTTTLWEGDRGIGSLQEFVDNSRNGLPLRSYSRAEQDKMAVLDYIVGNKDRHAGNYLTGPDGRLVAIDHGSSFPESETSRIKSSFVMQAMNRPLSAEVLTKVGAVDPAEVGKMLRASGVSRRAVKSAMERLMEVQRRGMITGEAWPGRFGYGDGS